MFFFFSFAERCFCLKLRSPFSTFAARNGVGRGGKRGECWVEFRLQRGTDPARTDAPAHGRFRISLRDKCGDKMEKIYFKCDKAGRPGWKSAEKEGTEGRAACFYGPARTGGEHGKLASNSALITRFHVVANTHKHTQTHARTLPGLLHLTLIKTLTPPTSFPKTRIFILL